MACVAGHFLVPRKGRGLPTRLGGWGHGDIAGAVVLWGGTENFSSRTLGALGVSGT